jgi:hypothetical protein
MEPVVQPVLMEPVVQPVLMEQYRPVLFLMGYMQDYTVAG